MKLSSLDKEFIAYVNLKIGREKLPISTYNSKYLARILNELPYRVKIFSAVIDKLLELCQEESINLSIIDYGGGTGLLSAYAKWRGVKRVLYIDNFEQSCIDAQRIAEALEIGADEFMAGELNNVDESFDAIISTDVIEHIYNLEIFFSEVNRLSPKMKQVHVTGSNPYNPLVNKKLKAIQLRNENEDREIPIGAKPSDEYRAYIKIREEWLRENYGNKLNEQEISSLKVLTRGRNFEDMQTILADYLDNKILPKAISHPTNTCNPTNGNWSERLSTQSEFQQLVNKYQWTCDLSTIGYNNLQGNILKRSLATILNCTKSKYALPLLSINIY